MKTILIMLGVVSIIWKGCKVFYQDFCEARMEMERSDPDLYHIEMNRSQREWENISRWL